MEIQTSKALSDVQQFRYELLQWCGNVEDAEKANTFEWVRTKSQYRRSYQNPA